MKLVVRAMNLRYLAVCVMLLSIALAAQSESNLREEGQFFLEIFDYKTYNGHQENWGFVSDDRDILYVANNTGILQYDGVSWQTIPTPDNIGAISIDRAADGTIYVGLENGFGYLRQNPAGQLLYHSISQYLPEEHQKVTDVWKTHALSEGVYFLTLSKVYFWANESFTIDSTALSALSVEVDDVMYFGDWRRGIVKLANGKIQTIPGGDHFRDVENYAIVPDQINKKIYVASPHPRAKGFFAYDGQTFTPLDTPLRDFVLGKLAYSGTSSGDQLVVGTIQGGAAIVDPNGKIDHVIDPADGLPNPSIVAPFFDEQNGLWMALVKGIVRAEINSPFSQFNSGNGLDGSIQTITRYKGSLYAGSQQGIYRLKPAASPFENSSFERIDAATGFVWALFPTERALLAATDKGLYEVVDNQATLIDMVWPRVTGLHRSLKFPQRIYLALQNGLYILTETADGWERTERLPELLDEFTTITGDENDVLWVGTNAQGTFRVEIHEPVSADAEHTLTARNFGPQDGLPNGEINVFKIDNKIVFSSERGLFRYDATQDTFLHEASYGDLLSESDRYIGRIKKDQQGSLWLASRSDEGPHVHHRSTEGNWNAFPFQRLDRLGEVRVIYPESNGVVWFGGSEGIIRYAPEVEPTVSPYLTNIRSVSLGDDSLIFTGRTPKAEKLPAAKTITGPELLYRDNALRFQYAAAFYDEAGQNEYQYFLDGFDPTWSNWSKETRKDYTNIPEGDYVFRVRARNIYDQVSIEDRYRFSILPPWYRTIWAYLGYALMGFAGLFVLLRSQVRKFEQRNQEALQREKDRSELEMAKVRAEAAELRARAAEAEKEREKEQMRSRIASDLHDEIGSNLSSISLISQILQEKEVLAEKERQRLQDVHSIASETANAMRDIVWFVNPLNDTMEKLIIRMRETANRMLDHLDFEFEAPGGNLDLQPDIHFRRNLFLIYKEALQNIVRHSQAERVTIRISADTNMLRMQIEDDGVGFDTAGKSSGNGLRNFQKRAKESGMSVEVSSTPSGGTTIDVQKRKIP